MTAKLTSTAVVFSDNTMLLSKYGIIPQNSQTIFFQASAPTGWTKSTAHDNKTLRVVSGNGGGSGGTTAFTSVFPNSLVSVSNSYPISGSVGDTTLTTNQIAAHGHDNGGSISFTAVPASYNPDGAFIGWNGGDVGRNPGWTRGIPAASGSSGSGGAHSHPFSGTVSFSQSIDLRIQYIDVIVCTYN